MTPHRATLAAHEETPMLKTKKRRVRRVDERGLYLGEAYPSTPKRYLLRRYGRDWKRLLDACKKDNEREAADEEREDRHAETR